jgi:hypothetical protein
MKRVIKFLGVFVCFFLTLFGLVLIARGLEITQGPLLLPREGWMAYHLNLADTFSFYLGCAVSAASLASLWSLRPK